MNLQATQQQEFVFENRKQKKEKKIPCSVFPAQLFLTLNPFSAQCGPRPHSSPCRLPPHRQAAPWPTRCRSLLPCAKMLAAVFFRFKASFSVARNPRSPLSPSPSFFYHEPQTLAFGPPQLAAVPATSKMHLRVHRLPCSPCYLPSEYRVLVCIVRRERDRRPEHAAVRPVLAPSSPTVPDQASISRSSASTSSSSSLTRTCWNARTEEIEPDLLRLRPQVPRSIPTTSTSPALDDHLDVLPVSWASSHALFPLFVTL